MTARKGTVVVADGDRGERELVGGLLTRAGYEAVEVGSGVAALEAGRAGGVVLVLLELELPDMTGYEVCRSLRSEFGDDLPVFLMSASRTEPLDRVAGLLLGADDFIVKPFDPSELIARVGRFVLQRTDRGGAGSPAGVPRLTQREREVLQLLAAGARQKEVAQQLSISPKTVATHIQSLFAKVGVHSRAELVARAYSQALVGLRP